jgi:hypothetical protein
MQIMQISDWSKYEHLVAFDNKGRIWDYIFVAGECGGVDRGERLQARANSLIWIKGSTAVRVYGVARGVQGICRQWRAIGVANTAFSMHSCFLQGPAGSCITIFSRSDHYTTDSLLLLLHNIVSRSEAATADNRLLFPASLLMRLTKIGDLTFLGARHCGV